MDGEYKTFTKNFHIECLGRNAAHKELLPDPIPVTLHLRVENKKTILMSVDCPYNTGAHGQRCKASHPDIDKIAGTDGILCPYSLDIPYILDNYDIVWRQEK